MEEKSKFCCGSMFPEKRSHAEADGGVGAVRLDIVGCVYCGVSAIVRLLVEGPEGTFWTDDCEVVRFSLEVEDGAYDSGVGTCVVVGGILPGPRAFFNRTWIAFNTPRADLAMEFLPLII